MQLNRLDQRERGTVLGFLLSRRLGFIYIYIYIYIYLLLNSINTINTIIFFY
jgi:hypothetical protein